MTCLAPATAYYSVTNAPVPTRERAVLHMHKACCGLQVYAIATEDMDALTFATPRLVRNLCAAASAKLPIMEYEYEKVLEGLKLSADQFVDLCILCGCDYCGSIKSEF